MNTDVKLADAKVTAARAFVRSLNILLKFTRLYGFKHIRTAMQFETTWNELHAAVSTDSKSGLLLGVAGSQLLLDGVALEAAAQRSLAQLLSAAGLASIHFSPKVTQEELACFVRAFPTGNAQPTVLAEQLKAALANTPGIRINEVRFVAEDAGFADAMVAAQLTARTLGTDAARVKEWVNDPQKLLQLIAAAQGSKSGGVGAPPAAGGGPAAAGMTAAGSAGSAPQVDDVLGILRVFNRLGQLSGPTGAATQPGLFQEQLSKLPERAQDTLRQALTSLAAQAPADRPNEPMLLKLAEHLAIRFALERYERGEVRVNAVRQMLARMSQEIENLRKVLGADEERVSRTGLVVESHADLLARQFWAAVPESGKRSVLLSPEAWCLPPRNVRQYIEELLGRGDTKTAHEILLRYCLCINSPEVEARRRTAVELTELAELYGSSDGKALVAAIRQAGAQLSVERDTELQSLVSAAFVRLTQEAAKRHCYPAIRQALDSLDSVENQRPAFAQSLRPRIGVEDRLPEFLEAAVRAEHVPEGLAGVLRLTPRPAMDHLLVRVNRCAYRQDCERLVALARELGPDGVSYLREQLRISPPAEAAETVGLLSRLDAAAVEQWLTKRVREFQRPAHDRMVRLLATCSAPERARLLLAVLDKLDSLIMPLALEEIGMSGDASGTPYLLRLAGGELPEFAGAYVQLKAIEALGRLRAHAAISALRPIAEAKQVWRWTHPSELRIAAVQALEKIDRQWAREFVPRSGLNEAHLAAPLAPLDPVADVRWCRQRHYKRIRLARPLAAVATNSRDTYHLEIKGLSLGGGLAGFDRHVGPGTLVTLKLGSGLRPIRAQAIVRDARAHGLGFEFVEMDLEERSKLRRLLAGELGPSSTASITTDPADS